MSGAGKLPKQFRLSAPPHEPKLVREIPGKRPEDGPQYTVTLRLKEFGDDSSTLRPAAKRTDRKLNLRIHKDDVDLLDALAEHAGIPRSMLLNRLLHDLLRQELLAVKDLDACALLANEADKRANYDDFELPWRYDVAGRFSEKAIENMIAYNQLDADELSPDSITNNGNSAFFKEISSRLKGIKG